MKFFKRIWRSTRVQAFRKRVAKFRRGVDPIYRLRCARAERKVAEQNRPYEEMDPSLWYPPIMGLEETLRTVIDHGLSMCRFGDGEFEIVAGRDMSFQEFDRKMQDELRGILRHPLPNCLCCIPNAFGSLEGWPDEIRGFWRGVAVWSREKVLPFLGEDYRAVPPRLRLGDTQVSRPYLGVRDRTAAPRVFALWKELVAGRDLLVVEGRFSRLGIGNDLLSGARSIRRIWCPPTDAYGRIDEILASVRAQATSETLIVLALGGTATILAYRLSNEGYQAVDAGHVDLEYMWMRMGVAKRVPVPGRYVNECVNGGREMIKVPGEEARNNVVQVIE